MLWKSLENNDKQWQHLATGHINPIFSYTSITGSGAAHLNCLVAGRSIDELLAQLRVEPANEEECAAKFMLYAPRQLFSGRCYLNIFRCFCFLFFLLFCFYRLPSFCDF